MIQKLRSLTFSLLFTTALVLPAKAQVMIGVSGSYMQPMGDLAQNLETGPISIGFQAGGGVLGGHVQLLLEYQVGSYQSYCYRVPYSGHHYQHSDADLNWYFSVHRVSPGMRIVAFPNALVSPYLEGRAGMQIYKTTWNLTDPYQYDDCASPAVLDCGVAFSDLSGFASGGGGLLFQGDCFFVNLGAQYVKGGLTRYLTANKAWADPIVRENAAAATKGTTLVNGPYTRHTSRTDGVQFQLGFGMKF